MCNYWKKLYLCGCVSHIYKERCNQKLLQPNSTCDDEGMEEEHRKSYFECYDCILKGVRAAKDQVRVAAENEAERMRSERGRRGAEQRSEREIHEEMTRERDRLAEVERQRRDGAWVNAASGKKGKGKRLGHSNSIMSGHPGSIGFPSPAAMPQQFPLATAGPGPFALLAQRDEGTGDEVEAASKRQHGAPGKENEDVIKNDPVKTVKDKAAVIAKDPTQDTKDVLTNHTKKPSLVLKDHKRAKIIFKDQKKGIPETKSLDKDTDISKTTSAEQSTDPGGRAGVWGPKLPKTFPPPTNTGPVSSPQRRILKNDHPQWKS